MTPLAALDYASLRAQLIPLHGLVGALAIIAGVAALSLPKRPAGHPWAGRVFLLTMGLSIAVAAPVILVGRNLFLMGVGLLVVYHGIVAWRLARLQPPLHAPTALDRVVHPLFGLVFAVFALFGLWAYFVKGFGMGIVAIVLASISLGSVRHFHRFMNLETFEQGEWVTQHIRGVATAFIASLTAFAAAAGPRLAPQVPGLALWLGPTVLFTPLFIWFGRQVEGKREAQ